MAKFRMTCTGTVPLIMHNARLSNPLDEVTKAIKRISGKQKKTDDDYEEMARLEHMGGLYFDPDVGPYLPGDNFERCLYDAATKSRKGTKVKEGVVVPEVINPIAYDGPRTVDGLWQDQNFRFVASVVVSRARVTRTRPYFRQWSVETDVVYDPGIINFRDLQDIVENAGSRVGLGTWRPKFGRFTATLEKID